MHFSYSNWQELSHWPSLWSFCLLRAASEHKQWSAEQRMQFLQSQRSLYVNSVAFSYLLDIYSIYRDKAFKELIEHYKLGQYDTLNFVEELLEKAAPNLFELFEELPNSSVQYTIETYSDHYLTSYLFDKLHPEHRLNDKKYKFAFALIEDAWAARIRPFPGLGNINHTTCLDELLKMRILNQPGVKENDTLTLVANSNPMDCYRLAWYLNAFDSKQFTAPDPREFLNPDNQGIVLNKLPKPKGEKDSFDQCTVWALNENECPIKLLTSYMTGCFKVNDKDDHSIINRCIGQSKGSHNIRLISHCDQDLAAISSSETLEAIRPQQHFISHPQNSSVRVDNGQFCLCVGAITGFLSPASVSLALLMASMTALLERPGDYISYNTETGLSTFSMGLIAGMTTRGVSSLLANPDVEQIDELTPQ